jgi:hypothetical protein
MILGKAIRGFCGFQHSAKSFKKKGLSLHLSAPIKTGTEVGMKESCGDNGNIMSEAVTGESAPMNRDVPQAGYRAP